MKFLNTNRLRSRIPQYYCWPEDAPDKQWNMIAQSFWRHKVDSDKIEDILKRVFLIEATVMMKGGVQSK